GRPPNPSEPDRARLRQPEPRARVPPRAQGGSMFTLVATLARAQNPTPNATPAPAAESLALVPYVTPGEGLAARLARPEPYVRDPDAPMVQRWYVVRSD